MGGSKWGPGGIYRDERDAGNRTTPDPDQGFGTFFFCMCCCILLAGLSLSNTVRCGAYFFFFWEQLANRAFRIFGVITVK